MAKVCKYYIRGSCKYGSRCHFLHERENTYYQENSYGSSERNYSYDNSGRYSSYDSSSRHISNDNSVRYTTYNANRNYNRYHIDNRYHNISSLKSITELPFHQIMDLVLRELQQFEERHVWKLTVIAPFKGLGNIPTFRDYSPEEIRYQYYECMKTGSTYEFERMYKELINHVQQCCMMFSMNSRESQDLIKQMIQQCTTQNEEMATEFTFSTTPSSPFNFSSPPEPQSFLNNHVAPGILAPTSNVFGNSVFGSSQSSVDFPVSSSNEVLDTKFSTPFMNSSVFGTTSDDQLNSQSNSKLNSFSFDLRNVASTNDSFIPSSNIPEPNSSLVDSIYSKLEELPADVQETFRARTFKYGHIPLMAPPKELCFG